MSLCIDLRPVHLDGVIVQNPCIKIKVRRPHKRKSVRSKPYATSAKGAHGCRNACHSYRNESTSLINHSLHTKETKLGLAHIAALKNTNDSIQLSWNVAENKINLSNHRISTS